MSGGIFQIFRMARFKPRQSGAYIRSLFTASEPGVWYDPSDLSTLFQDSAGTTPVTAVEQPVGRILDKSGRGNHATQATPTKRPVLSRRVNLLLATATLATQSITTPDASYRLTFSGAGSITLSGTASGVFSAGTHTVACTAGTLTLTVAGAVNDADFRPAAYANLPYQWVNTATDYDADPNKFPAYLRFDGVDDALETGTIDFTGTDKVTVWAGITKLSDEGGVVLEVGIDPSAVDGTFSLWASIAGPIALFWHRGTIDQYAESLQAAAPLSSVLSGEGDISGDRTVLRTDGVQTSSGSDVGTGNYGNYPLYIGARAGTMYCFDGRLYSLIVRGAQSSLSQIEATELYIKQKMRLP